MPDLARPDEKQVERHHCIACFSQRWRFFFRFFGFFDCSILNPSTH